MGVHSCVHVKGAQWVMYTLGLFNPRGFGGCSAHMAVTGHIPSHGKVFIRAGLSLEVPSQGGEAHWEQ